MRVRCTVTTCYGPRVTDDEREHLRALALELNQARAAEAFALRRRDDYVRELRARYPTERNLPSAIARELDIDRISVHVIIRNRL